jgi:hypothetical protein
MLSTIYYSDKSTKTLYLMAINASKVPTVAKAQQDPQAP